MFDDFRREDRGPNVQHMVGDGLIELLVPVERLVVWHGQSPVHDGNDLLLAIQTQVSRTCENDSNSHNAR